MSRKSNTQCEVCQTPLYRSPKDIGISLGRVYCSKAHYGQSRRKEFTCPVCNKVLLKGKHGKTCSKTCSNKNRAGSKYRGGSLERSFRVRVIEAYGGGCLKCGYTLFIEAHHIIKRRDGGNHEISNGIPLCRNHHAEAEHGYITIEELHKLQGELV